MSKGDGKDMGHSKTKAAMMPLVVSIVVTLFSATIFYFCWNAVAATYFYFLPPIYHQIGFWNLFAILFIVRSLTPLVRYHHDERS